MKKIIVLFIFIALLSGQVFSQPWMTYIPQEERGSANYFDHEKAFHEWKKDNSHIKWEKQFYRMEYLMNGRVDENGHFPSKLYYEESKRVIQDRKNRAMDYGSWTCMGPFYAPAAQGQNRPGGTGRIDCIAFHPTNPDKIYVGSPTGGLWWTDDGGLNWLTSTDNLATLGIADIKIHPDNPDTIYIVTGTRDTWWETYSAGILVSYDGGLTWQETGLNYNYSQGMLANQLIINPYNPSEMIVATSIGLYKSTDAADNWNLVFPGSFKDLKFAPGDFSTIYASTFNMYGGANVFISRDGGNTFSNASNLLFNPSYVNRITIETTPADPDVVYLLCSEASSNGFYGLYRSDDKGVNWIHSSAATNLNLLGWALSGMDNGGQGFFTLALEVDPHNADHVYVGGVNIWESTNSGASWTINAHWLGYGSADYVHADIHVLQYNYLNDVLYTGVDGGVYELQSNGTEWIDLSDGIVNYQLYKLGLYEGDDQLVLGSPQDNGTTLFDNGEFTELLLAEACDNFIDYTNPDIMYYGGYGSGYQRSLNGGQTCVNIYPPGANHMFNPPFIINPVNPKSLYSASNQVYRSYNRGDDWDVITENISTGSRFYCLEIAPSDTNYLYVSTATNIWMSSDYASSWKNIKAGLPSNSFISDIAISTVNPEHVWVTFQSFSTDLVYRSTDSGDTWENVTFNLPNIPATCAVYEGGSNNGIYVGTDLGVYYMDDDLGEWVDFNTELPNVMIDELEINYTAQKLVAATYGRGLWETPLIDSPVKIKEQDQVDNIKIYPNPTHDILNIEMQLNSQELFSIVIHDMLNKVVWKQEINPSGNTYYQQINIGHFPKGAYILQVIGEKSRVARKVLVK